MKLLREGWAKFFGFLRRLPKLTPEEAARADWEAIAGDWRMVGKDLEAAIKQYELARSAQGKPKSPKNS